MACASCRSYENARENSLRVIRVNVLAKLGFTSAPNTTGRALPPVPAEYMSRFERRQPPSSVQADAPAAARTFVARTEPDDFLARTDSVLIFAHRRRHDHFKGLKIIHFNITDKVVQNEVNEAILNFHIQELEMRNTTVDPEEYLTINLQVSRVTRNNSRKASVLYTNNSVKMKRKELREGKWLKVNVTTMVVEYCRLVMGSLAIIVRVQDSKNRTSLVVPHPNSESNNALMPYVEVSLRDNSHKRTRRNIGIDCTENSNEARCCRYPLVVNFEEFGWDWIIAPKVYNANYCSGECPYSFLQKYPHTHIVHLAAPQGSAGPCCAPRRMSSITMLYFNHDFNIIYGTLPGMVVESCGCS